MCAIHLHSLSTIWTDGTQKRWRLVVISGFPTSPVFTGTAHYINSVSCLCSLQTLEPITTDSASYCKDCSTQHLVPKPASLDSGEHTSLETQLSFPPLTVYPRVPTCFAPPARRTGQAVFSPHSPWNISNSIGRTWRRYLRSLRAVETYMDGQKEMKVNY